jgi:hypothetical protein
MESAMRTRIDRRHPAVKHGAYSATAVLPGESQAEFEKLHRGLVAELVPSGVLEDDIVMTIARLVWRKQNLTTLRIAESAQSRHVTIWNEKIRDNEPSYLFDENGEPVNTREEERQVKRAAESEAQEELGESYEFVEIGETATFDGLTGELAIQERLDAAIAKCLKQLLMVRGVKSIAVAPASATPKRMAGPTKAA